jgi:hypothetical protein
LYEYVSTRPSDNRDPSGRAKALYGCCCLSPVRFVFMSGECECTSPIIPSTGNPLVAEVAIASVMSLTTMEALCMSVCEQMAWGILPADGATKDREMGRELQWVVRAALALYKYKVNCDCY